MNGIFRVLTCNCNGSDFRVLRLFVACLVWLSTSVALTLTLKVVFDHKMWDFHYPLSVTIFSFLVSFVILLSTTTAPDALTQPEKRWSLLWQVVVPLSIGTAAEIATSNIAYNMISVSLICALKCSTLVTSFIGGVLIGVEHPDLYTFILVLLVLIGVILASKELVVDSKESYWQGVLWMIASSLAFSYRSLMTQKVNRTHSLNAFQMSYITMPFAALWLFPFAVTLESSIIHDKPVVDGTHLSMYLRFLSIPILGLVNMCSLFEVLKLSSSLTMAVLLSLRQLLSIGGAVVLFSDKWSIKGSIGMAVALFAMIEYARHRASLSRAAAAEGKDVEAATEHTPLKFSEDKT